MHSSDPLIHRLYVLVLGAFSAFRLFAAANQEPDLESLAKVGEANVQRFATNDVAWEVRVLFPNGRDLFVRRISATDGERWTLVTKSEGRAVPIVDIVERDGLWHVRDGPAAFKSRPYEATLRFPAAYALMEAATLLFVIDPSLLKAATYEGNDGDRVRYRVPTPPEYRQLLEATVAEARRNPEPFRSNAAQKANLEWIETVLSKGIPLEVDRHTALIRTRAERNFHIEVTDFAWLPEVPPGALAIPGIDWEDRSKPVTENDWSNVILVSHDPTALDAKKKIVPDGHSLSLSTGGLRRIPFSGMASLPLGFLEDRTTALVIGQSLTDGPQITYVDLEYGESEVLEIEGLEGCIPLGGAISRTADKLALLAMRGSNSLLDFQMFLVDLEELVARPLGKPARLGGPMSWLPDGSGLILKRFGEKSGPQQIEQRILCRLSLDGTLTDLVKGDSPLILPHAKRILFEDQESDEWFTCDFDGKNKRRFGNGMKGFGTPAVAPDEKEMLWVRFQDGEIPKLLHFKFEAAEGKPASKLPGFIGMPVW